MLPQLKIWTRICLMCVYKSLTLILTMLHILFPSSSLLWLFSLDSLPFSFNNKKYKMLRQQTRQIRKQQIEYTRVDLDNFFAPTRPKLMLWVLCSYCCRKNIIFFVFELFTTFRVYRDTMRCMIDKKFETIDKHLAEIIIQYFHCFLLLYVQFSRQTIAAFV